jgi:hypothetical protein
MAKVDINPATAYIFTAREEGLHPRLTRLNPQWLRGATVIPQEEYQ